MQVRKTIEIDGDIFERIKATAHDEHLTTIGGFIHLMYTNYYLPRRNELKEKEGV